MRATKESTWWIYVVAAVAMLPALLLRDATPDNELRYLSIADEALRDGSVWCFHNHGAVYADKPPLYMWIVMAGRALFGQYCMPFVELFSLIPMLLAGRVMNGMARSRLDIRRRQVAMLMLFTCGFFPGLALTLRMDMLLTLFIVLALREAFGMAQGVPTRRHEALLGLYTFLALFTKGPYGVLIPLLSTAVYLLMTRRVALMRRIWGWPAWAVLVGGCAVWFTGVYHEGGSEYLNNLLFHQTVDRAHSAFTHDRPWWYYAVCVWYVMAPWSLFIAWTVIARRHAAARGDFRKLMIAVFCTTLVMLSCVSSKLQVYLLPAIPFGVYWGASLMSGKKLQKIVRVTSYCILGLLFVVAWALPWVNPYISYGPTCREAARLNPTEVYVSSDIRRGENIDAYFDCPVTVSDLSDLSDDGSKIIIIEYERNGKLRFHNNSTGL